MQGMLSFLLFAGALQELVVHVAVYVDPLDRAAGLPRVVARAVDDPWHGDRQVGVRRHVGRVLATELETRVDEAPRLGRVSEHLPPAVDGARERDVVDRTRADEFGGHVESPQIAAQGSKTSFGGVNGCHIGPGGEELCRFAAWGGAQINHMTTRQIAE